MYVINTTTLGISEYSGWDEHVLIEHQGRSFFVKEDGLYEQTGEDDSGVSVSWSIETGNLILNGGKHYNIFQVTPLIRAKNNVQLTLFARHRGKTRTIGPFTLSMPDRQELREWPTLVGEGHKPTTYALQFSGSGPGEIRGSDVYVMPHIRGR